ncbi:MAG: 30S ribosomal protein S6 [Candidatus Aminicenantes bacterium]|nr:30S ribosomal protein S6 [Candidatus Aminicenantes bacterium]
MKGQYEIGYVLNPESTEEDVKKVADSILGIIKKAKGEIENVDEWGRRPLAYRIQNHNEGVFTFIKTDFDGSVVANIERRLRLSEKVMRFLVLRLDDKLKKANKLTKKWQKIDKNAKKTKTFPQKEKKDEEELKIKNEVKDE